MPKKTFRELEQEGWTKKAEEWENWLAFLTSDAIEAILDSLGDLNNRKFLDVACGTGHLSGAALQRNATCEGIDFAPTMIEIARKNYPSATFNTGSATELPFDENTFDAVGCSFGILHFDDPDKAIQEAFRVLKPGGRYSFTAWRNPEQGGVFFEIVSKAVQKYANMDVDLPPAPPIFRFSDADECESSLIRAGFATPTTRVIPLVWQAPSEQAVVDVIYKSAVRTPMIIEAQSMDISEKIHNQIIESAKKYRNGDYIAIPFPAIIASAQKP